MVIQTFLYICRGCGKQKKPTDQFCETCMKNGKQANASNTAPAIMLTRFRSLRIVEGSLVKSNGIGVSPSTSSPLQNGSYVVLGRNMETLEEVRLELTQRQSGLYVPGVAGAGKSTMLNNIITTDATNGHGIFVFDVQGDL